MIDKLMDFIVKTMAYAKEKPLPFCFVVNGIGSILNLMHMGLLGGFFLFGGIGAAVMAWVSEGKGAVITAITAAIWLIPGFLFKGFIGTLFSIFGMIMEVVLLVSLIGFIMRKHCYIDAETMKIYHPDGSYLVASDESFPVTLVSCGTVIITAMGKGMHCEEYEDTRSGRHFYKVLYAIDEAILTGCTMLSIDHLH